MLREFKTLDPAEEARGEGEFIWERELPNKAREYLVGTYAELYEHFCAQERPCLAERFYDDEPVNLFVDMDWKGASPEQMQGALDEVVQHVQGKLQELYSVGPVAWYHWDGSRAAKQSKHLYFDVRFRTPGDAGNFMQRVAAECSARVLDKKGKERHVVDMGLYFKRNASLRLPRACKLDPTVPRFTARNFAPFERSMVNVVDPALRLTTLLECKGSKRARVALDPLWDKLVDFLSKGGWGPRDVQGDGVHFSCMLSGIPCPDEGRPHGNNHTFMHVHVKDERVTEAYFRCPECTGGVDGSYTVYWVPWDLNYVLF